MIAHRVQEAVDSTPQGAGGETAAPRTLPVVESSSAFGAPGAVVSQEPPGRSGHDGITPRQQALHVARECMRIKRTLHRHVEIYPVVRQLAVALGASRTEGGTIKALHAVLLQLDRPGMNDIEAYTSAREPACPTSRSGEGGCTTPTRCEFLGARSVPGSDRGGPFNLITSKLQIRKRTAHIPSIKTQERFGFSFYTR